MKMILASNNAHKVREFGEILAESGIELISQRDAGCDFEVDETGDTFEENAFLKADAVMRATGEVAVADDSGLAVDALNGEPGVRSARYTGRHDDTDYHRRLFLLQKLQDEEHRTARFVSSICCVFPDGRVLRARGECEGTITREMLGENGFGYDCIFQPEGFDRTMGQLSAEEKNAISHRGRALRDFAEKLRKENADNK